MAHVSSKRLKEEEENLIKSRLIKVFRLVGKNRNSSYALKELLTDTEMIMLAKRLGMIYFVGKGMTTLEISYRLKVSTSTVLRVEKRFDRKGYQYLRGVLKKLEPSLLDMLEIILQAGMPPIVGKGRWKFLKDY